MRAVSVLVAIAAARAAAQNTVAATGPTTGAQGNASTVEDNPPGNVYEAKLPQAAFTKTAFPAGGNIVGSISAESNPNGIGVKFVVSFRNLPPLSQGPFLYHIHDQPVPDGGNCTATLAHLDPFIRGEDPACDATLPQTCQVGDLSGKHGKITRDPFETTYSDDFASLKPGIGAFFGNRSFVVHFPNKTRITCANFKLVSGTAPSPISSAAAAATSATSASSTDIPSGSNSSLSASNTPATTAGPTQPLVTVSGAGVVQSAVWAVGSVSLLTALMFML